VAANLRQLLIALGLVKRKCRNYLHNPCDSGYHADPKGAYAKTVVFDYYSYRSGAKSLLVKRTIIAVLLATPYRLLDVLMESQPRIELSELMADSAATEEETICIVSTGLSLRSLYSALGLQVKASINARETSAHPPS
jgi:hypothetical protein